MGEGQRAKGGGGPARSGPARSGPNRILQWGSGRDDRRRLPWLTASGSEAPRRKSARWALFERCGSHRLALKTCLDGTAHRCACSNAVFSRIAVFNRIAGRTMRYLLHPYKRHSLILIIVLQMSNTGHPWRSQFAQSKVASSETLQSIQLLYLQWLLPPYLGTDYSPQHLLKLFC